MQTLILPNPYIYAVNISNWQHHSTAPLPVKLLVYISITAVVFFIFHTVMMNTDEFVAATWIQELYFNLWVLLPFSLFIIGKSVQNRQQRTLLLAFCAMFGICYLLNIGNTYEWVDIPHLQYPMSIALLGILVTWIVIVVKRKKTILDALKFLWLFGMIYSFVVPRFVPGGHEAGNFLLGSMLVFPFMMALGFVNFFRKPKTVGHGT